MTAKRVHRPWIKAAIPHIVERVRRGEYAKEIAKEIGMPWTTLSYHLSLYPGYQLAQQQGHRLRLSNAIADSLRLSSLARMRHGAADRYGPAYRAKAYDRYLALRLAGLARPEPDEQRK